MQGSGLETAPQLVGRRASFVLGALAVTVCGCSSPWPVVDLPLPRNKATDFIAKDFELRPYEVVRENIARRRRAVEPSSAAAALGDTAGAFAGGYRESWSSSAGAALGDMGGAVAGEALTRATRLDPLPKTYTATETIIPIIATDPNSGPTIGIMPISVIREGDRITDIFAPQITYNQIDGEGALFRMRRTFTLDSAFSVDAGSTTNGAHTYDLRYNQAKLGPAELLLFRARFRYATELNDRFYGLGSDSDRDAESSYTFHRTDAIVGLGVALPFSSRIELAEMLSVSSVGEGKVKGIPSSRSVFPDVKGMQDTTELLGHRITLTIDTRDHIQAPENGVLVDAYYEVGDATLLSDVSYQKAGFSFSGVVSYTLFDSSPFPFTGLFTGVFATAGRFGVRWVAGKNVPFYEQTSIGGKYTLRGFGDGRFIGKNGLVSGIEERWNFWDFKVMGYELVLQVAGFAEMGRVFGGGDEITLNTIKLAGGGALRLIIPSSDIVTSLDLGVSKEGVQTFFDLGYAF